MMSHLCQLSLGKKRKRGRTLTATAYPALVDSVERLRCAVKEWVRAASYLKSLGVALLTRPASAADESRMRSAQAEEDWLKREAEALMAHFEP